jgi:GT2 family glycosyltransferase
MAEYPQTEVVVATYKKPERLRLVLAGLARQTIRDFSVVIADDGSGPEIETVTTEYTPRLQSIRHVWHEDLGFRKTKILNEAVRSSTADYLIFIDADCIPERGFVSDHLTFARPRRFVAGRRVFLGPDLTERLLRGEVRVESLDNRARLAALALAGRLTRSRYAVQLPWPIVNARRHARRGVKGANMAMWRSDLLRINGFDGDMTGPGDAEDDDLEWRLLAVGCAKAWMSGRGCVFHLHHTKTKTNSANAVRMHAKQSAREIWAANGLLAETETNRGASGESAG